MKNDFFSVTGALRDYSISMGEHGPAQVLQERLSIGSLMCLDSGYCFRCSTGDRRNTADPNYFSPFSEKCDSPGRSEGITLDYSLSKSAATVQLRVYSVESGELLRTASVQNVAAGANEAFWDGKNQAGEYVDIGDYQVGLIATDAQGNSSMLRYALVRVDY